MKLSELKIDATAFEEGGWVDNIPGMGNLRLRVRGINNAAWRRLQSKLIEATPRAKKNGGRVDPDEMDRITNVCLRETCLLDWEGLEDDAGQPIPFSKPAAGKILDDPELREFRDGVAWAASVVAQRDQENTADVVGN
jgi:hypothetical protein